MHTAALLCLSIAIIGSNSLMLSPIASAVAASLGHVDGAGVMLAAAAYGAGTAISALTLAPQVDRIGAGKTLTRGMFGLALALAMSSMAWNLPSLCVAQAGAGVAAGAALPAIYALATKIARPGHESETLGIVLTGWTISMVLGVSLSALIADILHWRAVWGLLALLASTVLLLISRSGELHEAPVTVRISSPLTALRVPGISTALIVCACYMMAFYGLYSFLGAHLTESLGQTTAIAGLASVAYGLGFGAAVPFDRWMDRIGAARAALPVFGVLCAIYLLLGMAGSSFLSLLVLCAVWGLINHLALNVIVQRLSALDPSQRGSIMGLYSAVTYLCVCGAALLFRPVFLAWGLAACAALSALCLVPAIIDAIRTRRVGAVTPAG